MKAAAARANPRAPLAAPATTPQASVAPTQPPAHLLDGNVLVALLSSGHVHHDLAQAWFESSTCPFATCPITQGTLVRMLMQLEGLGSAEAVQVLHGLTAHPRHHFWPDSLAYGQILLRGVLGHRQVTDAYLAALARHHGARLATMDKGLAALHGDVAVMLAAG